MQGHGLYLVGEFDGTNDRTVSPKEGGKVFSPFKVELIVLICNDETRSVEYREGKRPDTSGLSIGDTIVVPVRVRDIYQGVPRFDGRSAAITDPSGKPVE